MTAAVIETSPYVGSPVPDVSRNELADPVVMGLPVSWQREVIRDYVRSGFGELRSLAARIADESDVVSAMSIAFGAETDVRNAHAVIAYRMSELGLVAKATIAKLPRKLSEESIRNRASLGAAIVRHGCSEGEADVIAKGINRPHQRGTVRQMLAADECDIPQLTAWILATAKQDKTSKPFDLAKLSAMLDEFRGLIITEAVDTSSSAYCDAIDAVTAVLAASDDAS